MKVKSWDGHLINDGTNYTAVLPGLPGFPEARYATSNRPKAMPVLGQMSYRDQEMPLAIAIEGSVRETLIKQLAQWFDPKGDVSRQLIVTDDDGSSNERYLMCRPKSMELERMSGRRIWVIKLAVDGTSDPDGRYRRTSTSSDAWNITATGQTNVVNNQGQDDAYPVYKIMPTSGKTGTWAYSRWLPIRWRVSAPASGYPVDVVGAGLDTAGLISGAKLQADGDDLRLRVNGVEVDFWAGNFNAATSRIWTNLDFASRADALLASSIASSGSISEIVVSPLDAITGRGTSAKPILDRFPASGVLMIGSEAFVYTGIDYATSSFTGVSRAANFTSMAAHSALDTIWWVQHDIWLLYGNSAAAAPDIDDARKPLFNLDTSTNSQWNYADFASYSTIRTGSWSVAGELGLVNAYSANQKGASVEPFEVMGMHVRWNNFSTQMYISGRIRLYNPCGITRVVVSSGAHFSYNVGQWDAKIQSSADANFWIDEASIAAPSTDSVWDTWTADETLTYGFSFQGVSRVPTWFAIYCRDVNGLYNDAKIEVDDVTAYLDTNNTPVATLGSEQSAYLLDGLLANTTTGESIAVQFLMSLNEILIINTDQKTVVYDKDGSNQFQAVDLGPLRRDWLKLEPGNNTLQWTESGVNAVTITTEWVERFYYG